MRALLKLAPRAKLIAILCSCAATAAGCSGGDGDAAVAALSAAPATAALPAPAKARSPARAALRDHTQRAASARTTHHAAALRDGAPAAADAARPYDVLRYDVRGAFDMGASTLHATLALTVALDDASVPAIVLDSRVRKVTRVNASGHALPFTEDAAAGLLTLDVSSLERRAHAPLTVEIAYEAGASDALTVSAGIDSDPSPSRVAFTHSEPLFGSLWLPGNHRPSDRAKFSIALDMDRAHDLVSNGRRLRDVATAGGRHEVAYATDFTLPTYLMAFALGDLVHADACEGGGTPLAVWHRRGVAVDTRKHLALLGDLLRTFEKLLGPYPFDTYSVVLLPEADGGMENATITFNDEASGQGTIDVGLNAHELAHHWFGDWVTVKDWDDVWIKEGMATLLAAEADRADLDRQGHGRLFGDQFMFAPYDAVRDPSLGGGDGVARYTSGPYQRAAWLLTQIRSVVGDAAFFRALRRVLATHAQGSIGSDDFVAAFAPGLDAATRAKAVASLDRFETATLAITPATAPPDAMVWSVDDPEGVLIAPFGVTSVDARGVATSYRVTASAPVTVPVAPGGYIAPDEDDVHPDLESNLNLDPTSYSDLLAPHLVPTAADARRALLTRSAAQQELVLASGDLPLAAASFVADDARLGSTIAQGSALAAACSSMQSAGDPAALAEWERAIFPVLQKTPAPATFSYGTELPQCGVVLPTRVFAAQLPRLLADDTGRASERLDYAMAFDLGAPASFDAFAPLARTSSDAFLRQRAVERLAEQVRPGHGFSAVDASEAPRWKAFFRERMEASTTPRMLRTTYRGALGLMDADALPVLARKLKTSGGVNASYDVQMVCGAYAIADANGIARTGFQDALRPWDTLPAPVQGVLSDPSLCGF
jgi:aminopeptidase N